MKNEHEILSYIKKNPVAILSTLGKDNKLYGAAVYMCALSADHLYFITKTETQKFQNLQLNPEVGVTITNQNENSSLQANGQATVIENNDVIGHVMSRMPEIYAHGADWLPPITKIRTGVYQVVGIKLHQARLAHYKGFRPGDKRIFKEL